MIRKAFFSGGTTTFIVLCLFFTAGSASAQSRSNRDGQRGIVYEGRNLRTEELYVGKASSADHYPQRQDASRKRTKSDYEFRVVEEPMRGDLQVREEFHIRRAIEENGRNKVENKVAAMEDKRYREAVEIRKNESPEARRARLEEFEKSRFERGKQEAKRREAREKRRAEAERRLERMREQQENQQHEQTRKREQKI